MTAEAIPFERALSSWRVVLSWIFVYCLFHAVLRPLLSPVIGLEEAEQVLAAQVLALGYDRSQPPLHAWSLWWASEQFGSGLLTLVAIRSLLLMAGFAAFYGAGRELLARPAHAGLALAGLGFVFPIAFGMHQDDVHGATLFAAAALTLWIVAALGRRRHLALYVALGLVIAPGMLSRYEYALVPVALGAALATTPYWRRVLLDWRMLVVVALPAALLAPYAVWLVGGAAPADPVAEAAGDPAGPFSILRDLVAATVLQYALPLVLVAGFCFPRLLTIAAWKAAIRDPAARFLLTAIAAGLLAAVVVALVPPHVSPVEPGRQHLLLPVLFSAPIALFLVLESAGRAGIASPAPWRIRDAGAFLALFAAAWTAAGAGLAFSATRPPPHCGECRLQQPLVPLADALAQAGLTSGTIIAGDTLIGGNLAAAMPAMRVYSARHPGLAPPPSERDAVRCVAVWRADSSRQRLERLSNVLEAVRGLPMPADISPRSFNLPMSGRSERTVRYNYLVLPPMGDCV